MEERSETAERRDEKKRVILYVITKANIGGAQRYVFDLACHARNLGHRVIVMYGEDGQLRELLEKEKIETVRSSFLERDVNMGDIGAFLELWRTLRNIRPDVVHLNSSKAGGLGALAARFAGVPKIFFTAHGWASTESRPTWQKILIASLHWMTVLLSHQSIVVSHYTKRELRGWPFIEKKMQVIYNAPQPTPLPSQEEARQIIKTYAPHIDPSALWIGTGTELHPNKGLDIAIRGFTEVAARFPKSILCIIGEGEERAYLEDLRTTLGLSDRVIFLGTVPQASKILKAFDLFLLASRKEGFPYIILEAGLAGVPVIASSVGGIPEAIKDMETGILVHPQRPTEVARALSALLEHPDRRTSLALAFRKDIEKRFSFERMLNETFALYDQ